MGLVVYLLCTVPFIYDRHIKMYLILCKKKKKANKKNKLWGKNFIYKNVFVTSNNINVIPSRAVY